MTTPTTDTQAEITALKATPFATLPAADLEPTAARVALRLTDIGTAANKAGDVQRSFDLWDTADKLYEVHVPTLERCCGDREEYDNLLATARADFADIMEALKV